MDEVGVPVVEVVADATLGHLVALLCEAAAAAEENLDLKFCLATVLLLELVLKIHRDFQGGAPCVPLFWHALNWQPDWHADLHGVAVEVELFGATFCHEVAAGVVAVAAGLCVEFVVAVVAWVAALAADIVAVLSDE